MNSRQEALFEEIARNIRNENEAYTKQLYKQHKAKFVSWFMKQYQLNQQEGLALYHQSFLVLYYQIKQERLTSLMSSIETYLFGIGKKFMLKEQAKNRNFQNLAEVDLITANNEVKEQDDRMHQKILVRHILRSVKEPCKSILIMYYYRDFSLESIANRLGYKNSGAIKKKKSLCLKHIREQLKNQID